MSGIINKIKDVMSHDKDSQARAAHYDETVPSEHAGHHNTSGHQDTVGHHDTVGRDDTVGHHSSSTMNKADPLIDSSRGNTHQ